MTANPFQKATRPGRGANRRSPILDRFFSHIELDGSCWAWTGYVSPNGYGQMGDNRRIHYVHRWAYEHFIGPIPEGLVIDHLCRNRRCVNPAHLEPVTAEENWRRGDAPSAISTRGAA